MSAVIPMQAKNYIYSKFRRAARDLRTRQGSRKNETPMFDHQTGLDNETIKNNVMSLAEDLKDLPHQVVKARAFEYIARNIRIDVSPNDWFVSFGCWDRYDRPLAPLINKWDQEINATRLKTLHMLEAHNQSGTSSMWKDFDHSVPGWDDLLSLGFAGIRDRARLYRNEREKRGEETIESNAYFDGIEITYSAIIEGIGRFKDHALLHANGNQRLLACAKCLESLQTSPPSSTYESLQFIYLYFMFSEYIDRYQARSLGNLDRLILPFYVKDLKDGRIDELGVRELLDHFLLQWAAIDNYWGQPVYLGGTKGDGESAYNELSYIILDEYDKLGIYTPKIQLKIANNTPQRLIDKALDMVRRGHNSLVFVGEESIKRALMGIGTTEEEARTCDISGCYEFSPKGKSNETIVGYINMLKPFELIFNDGVDLASGSDFGVRVGALESIRNFDHFYAAYLKQLGMIIEDTITCASEFEQYLSWINPANVFSATVENSLKTARDAFQNGSVYNFSAILQAGFGTAIDALMAIRKFVYERREITLPQFRDILRANWKDHERLRLQILHSKEKFGNGIDAVDFYAETLARFMANKINMRPSGRGGFYVASMHSARQFIILGEKTGATPDGRLDGEEMSKNISPTMGMDANGVTALIKSVTRIDSAQFPGDFPLDVMMHPATVQGDDGLAALRTLLMTYFDKHGIAIHFNLMDAKTLLEAQAHPDKYQGLQVRVCGWNVHFTELDRKEQDMYIKRAQNIVE